MKLNRNAALVVAVGALAYVAGQANLFRVLEPSAIAAQPGEVAEMEMTEEMLAWMEAGTPGEQHEFLKSMEGVWEGRFEITMEPGQPAMVSEGVVEREWVLGGRFLRETITAQSAMGDYEAIGYIGYDNIDGVYRTAWMDNMSTAIYSDTGSLNPQTNLMTFRGSYRDPVSGQLRTNVTIINMSKDGVQTFVAHETRGDGKTFVSMKGMMTRRD
jgi:Protein of unknown function (DUF1579)